MSNEKKRIVLWGTGVVGSMVLAEIIRHPRFELVGVGVSNPEKVAATPGSCAVRAKPASGQRIRWTN